MRLLVLLRTLALLEITLVVLLDLLDCLNLLFRLLLVAAVSRHDLVLDILGKVLTVVVVELVVVAVTLHLSWICNY